MKKNPFYTVCVVLLFTILCVMQPALLTAGEKPIGEGGKVYSIQKKAYKLKNEVHLAAGVLPMDAFYKGFAFGGGYTYHFSHHFGWEVVQGLFSLNVDTGLKDSLIASFGAEPEDFQEVNFMANSNLIFTPLYGKMSFMNRKVIYMECFLTAGPGIAQYSHYTRVANTISKEKDYHFSANFGIGFRIFLTKRWSSRLDIRDYMNFINGGVDHMLYIGLGVGWNFIVPKFSDLEEDDQGL